MTVVMLGGGIDLSVGSIFALSTFAAVSSSSSSSSRSGWRWLAVARHRRSLFGAINGYLVGYLRLRAFLTTLVTFIFGRALYDILVVNYRRRRAALRRRHPTCWDFIGDGTLLRPVDRGLAAIVLAHRHPCRADPLAARLARAGGRRLAPLGPQCRHPGARARCS